MRGSEYFDPEEDDDGGDVFEFTMPERLPDGDKEAFDILDEENWPYGPYDYIDDYEPIEDI